MEVDLFGNEIVKVNNLKKLFLVEPYSVINTRDGNWQKLKKYWKNILNEDGTTREEENFNIRRNTGIQKRNNETPTEKQKQFIYNDKNISLFDPVISQLCYEWFCIKDGHVIDCCAGDTMKGNVIAHLGGKWTGIELRKQQVIHNNNKAFNGAKWICDTGENITKHIDYNSADMILSCPPYFNLEVYSELENDISNAKSYDIFINSLRKMYIESIKCLKENSFACIVIQNIRKVKSQLYIDYYPFKEDVIKIFTENGMFFYNDIVILKANGTAQMRAIPYMNQKKIVPIHEYLLVFYKGNFKNIKYKFK